MKTTARAVALSLLSVLVLSGCLKMEVNFTIQEDDTVSGDVVMAFEEGAGEALGMSDEDLTTEMFTGTEDEFPEGEVSEYNEDGYIGQRITFENQPLSEFTGDDGSISITRDDDANEFIVEGPAPGAGEQALGELPAEASMTMTVTFPGDVSDTNGVISPDDHTTVTWDLATTTDDVYARGGATEGSDFPLWIVLVAGVALGLLIGIILWLTLRNKRDDNDTAEDTHDLAADSTFAPLPVDESTQSVAPDSTGTEGSAVTDHGTVTDDSAVTDDSDATAVADADPVAEADAAAEPGDDTPEDREQR
ncbi:LppM family (lipo)protein [Demequina sediminicola]|uniref:LppM family (lipo)protein n=1 Tax=Demequina sediminicola TaxID=1095026 RepID=UPI00078428F7|nr:hypothetical protein [Demequina sediminicola]